MRPLIYPNDSYSYEDWMNDMATREPRGRRGWHAQWQTRCDCCGRFLRPGEPGGSWVMVPATDWNSGDERERCQACTEKHGQAYCGPGYVEHLCCGMNPTHNGEVRGASRLAGEASSAEGATSTVVLGTDSTDKEV